MRLMLRSLFLILILIICSNNLFAQLTPDPLQWQIETIDGNLFVGRITQQDEENIVLETENYGTMTIRRTVIRSMAQIEPEELVGGELNIRNPHASRYFFGPNGYGLKQKQGYYENTWILFNQLSYGFHDYITVGVGMLPLFLLGGSPTPVWITPKVQFPVIKDKINLGAGVLMATVLGEEASFGIAYGVATFGPRDKNFTVGVGYGFSDQGWADVPTFTLSGITRVSRKTLLMTENYYINTGGESVGIISFGGRSVQRKLAISYGLIIPLADIGEFVAIPWLGIAIPFGSSKAMPASQQLPVSILH